MNELILVNGNEIILADEAVIKMKSLIEAKVQYDKLESRLRDELKEAMEKHGVIKFDHPLLSATYKKEHARESFDSKKFKEEYPLLYSDFVKISTVKSSVAISLK